MKYQTLINPFPAINRYICCPIFEFSATHILHFSVTQCSGESRISRWVGTDPLGWRQPPTHTLSAKMYAKTKEIDPVGGCTLAAPPGSPPMQCQYELLIFMYISVCLHTAVQYAATAAATHFAAPVKLSAHA